MARIRTIKPEITQSESLGRVSREARLCFILLWTQADDDGRLRANSRLLASLLYPYDDDAKSLIDGWLNELETEGCIRRYEADGDHYLDIPKWLEHQKIDHPRASKFPAFREHSRSVANPSAGPRTKDQGPRIKEASRDKSRTLATDLLEYEFSEADRTLVASYGLNPDTVFAKIKNWAANAAPAKRRKRDVAAFLRNWCADEKPERPGETREPAKPIVTPDCWKNGLAPVAARASPALRSFLYRCVPMMDDDLFILDAPSAFDRDELMGRHAIELKKLWPAGVNVRIRKEAA